ncbi:hypothetical protein BaRGS_00017177 [Batillaria attramentaria]|uniref:Uncharacterized protein n=1 Tax=Batillaria attramentaria TaxID=370345 RepID=A0ABD0KX75_9CAEN
MQLCSSSRDIIKYVLRLFNGNTLPVRRVGFTSIGHRQTILPNDMCMYRGDCLISFKWLPPAVELRLISATFVSFKKDVYEADTLTLVNSNQLKINLLIFLEMEAVVTAVWETQFEATKKLQQSLKLG